MSDIRATSWSHLQELLFEDSWRPEIQRYRSRYAFRGMSDATQELATGLRHLGGDFITREQHLIRNFVKYAYAEGRSQDSLWDWLSLAAHHGLPTRLLDWTYSPYVALHFATSDLEQFDTDAVVWCVNCVKTNTLLADRLKEALEDSQAEVFTAAMLHEVAPDLKSFDGLATDPFLAFFEPPSLDARIVNQFALFSVMSSPAESLGAWLLERPELYRKVILPAKLKWEIRDKLDQVNLNERVLFPGLDGLCSWLRRHYTQR